MYLLRRKYLKRLDQRNWTRWYDSVRINLRRRNDSIYADNTDYYDNLRGCVTSGNEF